MPTELRYYYSRTNGVSLDPLQSDDMGNAILMKHVVGTLVRYANGGQFEPYLAESFGQADGGKVWTFRLRPGLSCQDGERITAAGFIEGFQNLLRSYSRQGPLPTLSDLDGWSEFQKGSPLRGLVAVSENEVSFRFARPAGPGFLEYLSMPYYGYFCRANFKDGKWVSHLNIVSSGPYELASPITDPTRISLSLRGRWPLAPQTAPRKVLYVTKIDETAWDGNASIVQTSLKWDQPEPEKFRRIWGPPDNICAAVLDTDGPSGFFKNSDVRRIFQAKLIELRSRKAFPSKNASIANAFYAGKSDAELSTASNGNSVQPKQPLLVFAPSAKTDEVQFAVDLTKEALKELQWPFELRTPGQDDGIVSTDAYKRHKFDVRVTGVVAGSTFEPWVVEMMFCSNLGVSFPDPSGRICEYTHGIIRGGAPFSVKDGGIEVSRIVHEDASVVPIYHGRSTWYFSNDLDVSRISGDLILPSFEDVAIKGSAE